LADSRRKLLRANTRLCGHSRSETGTLGSAAQQQTASRSSAMNQFLRWQTLAPRVLMVVVALLTVQYVLGRLVKSIATGSSDVVVGRRVAVDHARVAVLDRQLHLGGFRIEEGRGSARNWIEADHVVLDVVTTPFFYKQTLVDRGTVSGLRFGGSSPDEKVQSSGAPQLFGDNSARRTEDWFEQLCTQFQKNWVSQFKSVQLADELLAEWPKQTGVLEKRLRDLRQRANDLQRVADAAQANPLRHGKQLDSLPTRVESLRNEFAQVDVELENLLATLDTHRRAIVAARQQDEQLVRERLRTEPADASALTAYLLCGQIAKPIDEALNWLRWTRNVAPAQPAPRRGARGEDILFAGCRPAPQVLIRALELQGTSRLGGQPVELRGMLTDLSTTPSRHSKPIRLRLKSSGPQPLDLQAIIDRTGAVPRDELIVKGSGISLPKLSLGRPDQFALALEPSLASLSTHLVASGETLVGDIQLVQTRVQILPVLSGNVGDVPLAMALGESLRTVDSLTLRISISGTLADPKCTLWSNIGPKVAEALQLAIGRAADDRARKLLARAQRQVDERLAGLERAAIQQHADLFSQLTSSTGQLETIANRQSVRPRLSHEQLGRRLPANSLFR
jgi:uncharacterized protein (TIGR03545 family)